MRSFVVLTLGASVGAFLYLSQTPEGSGPAATPAVDEHAPQMSVTPSQNSAPHRAGRLERTCGAYEGELEPVATLMTRPRRWSMAVVRDYPGAPTKVVGLGHRVGDHALIDIERGRLVFERARSSQSHRATSTRFECADLGDRRTASPAASESTPPRTTSKAALAQAIRRTGRNRYAVSAQTVLDALQTPGIFRGEGKALPHYRNGAMHGIKLARLRNKGLAGAVGLRQGDVITQIDGQPLTSISAVLRLRDRVKPGHQTQIQVLRRGRPIQIRFDME